MKCTVGLLWFGLIGCPSKSGFNNNAEQDGGNSSSPDGAIACGSAPTCATRFRYPAAGANTVELRGDFRADGWTRGEPLSKNGEFFELSLDLPDDTTVQYKFVVDGEWLADPSNPSTVPDGAGGVNSLLQVDCDGCLPKPGFDWRDGIMYFVFLDRFLDGDSKNSSPMANVPPEANYFGGDLAGLLQKIEDGYFTDLSINVLWLSSPVDNADEIGLGADGRNYSGYHGYWPKDMTKVEPRLGDEALLKQVIEAAHARGIKVVFDYVMNHVSNESPTFLEHNDWFWPLYDGDRQCVCGGGCGWGGDDGRRCWFRDYLPDFNFTNQTARNFSIDNAIYWAKNFGVDGFRLDAVKHIETQWIYDLRTKVKQMKLPANNETFYMVGETFDGDAGLISSYVNPDTMLDGQFDFPLRAQIVRVLLGRNGSMNEFGNFLSSNRAQYHPRSVMGTFIGNHDLPRVVHLAENNPLFGEWDGGGGRAWDNRPNLPGGREPFERLRLAYAFLFTSPGLPLIYYGDEIALPGGGDPDNRRPMAWSGINGDQTWLRDEIKKLTALRAAHPALRRGNLVVTGSSNDVLVYKMSSEGEEIFVALNRSDATQSLSGLPGGMLTDLLTGQKIVSPTTLPARGIAIVTSH